MLKIKEETNLAGIIPCFEKLIEAGSSKMDEEEKEIAKLA